jgi:hypothetical protein
MAACKTPIEVLANSWEVNEINSYSSSLHESFETGEIFLKLHPERRERVRGVLEERSVHVAQLPNMAFRHRGINSSKMSHAVSGTLSAT